MGTEGEVMAVDQIEEGEGEVMAADQMVRTGRRAAGVAFRAIRGAAEQKEVMGANLVEVMAADLMVGDMAADLKEEGTTANLEGMAADQRVVMAADLELEVKQGRMVMVAAGEDSRAIKVEVGEERGLEVIRKEEDFKTEVEEEVTNVRMLVRGALAQQQDLLEGLLCPQDMTDKVPVTDRVLELVVVDTILGDRHHLLQGVMIGEVHLQ